MSNTLTSSVTQNLFDNGCFAYHPGFLPASRAGNLLESLETRAAWQQEYIKVFGREVAVPRRVAWYGDAGVSYSYSNVDHPARGWSAALSQLKAELEQYTSAAFNFVLLNGYPDGDCSMGWHSDDERELGAEPVIASISLGATRRFRVRAKTSKHSAGRRRYSQAIDLEHGSLLVMRGASQRDFEHCLTKTAAAVSTRVNLTFRNVLPV